MSQKSAADLEPAARMLEDGASYREIARTTGIDQATLRKYFPKQGWTYVQGGERRALDRAMKVKKL